MITGKNIIKKIGVKVFKINFENNLNIFKFFFVLAKIKKKLANSGPIYVHAHLLTMELIGAH